MRPASEVVDFFDGTSSAFDRAYSRDPNFEERLAVWNSLIREHAAPDKTVLDVGCGPGHLSCMAAALGMATTGVDPSPRMLALAHRQKQERGLANVEFREGTLDLVRDEGLSADLVLCSSVLEYLPALDVSLQILAAAVRPGGRLFVSLPNAASWYRRLERIAFAVIGKPAYRRYVHHVVQPERFVELATRVGLRMVETRFFGTRHMPRSFARVVGERAAGALFVMVLEPAR